MTPKYLDVLDIYNRCKNHNLNINGNHPGSDTEKFWRIFTEVKMKISKLTETLRERRNHLSSVNNFLRTLQCLGSPNSPPAFVGRLVTLPRHRRPRISPAAVGTASRTGHPCPWRKTTRSFTITMLLFFLEFIPLEIRLLPKSSTPLLYKLLKTDLFHLGWTGSASE